jgi:hypothetical protein
MTHIYNVIYGMAQSCARKFVDATYPLLAAAPTSAANQLARSVASSISRQEARCGDPTIKKGAGAVPTHPGHGADRLADEEAYVLEERPGKGFRIGATPAARAHAELESDGVVCDFGRVRWLVQRGQRRESTHYTSCWLTRTMIGPVMKKRTLASPAHQAGSQARTGG